MDQAGVTAVYGEITQMIPNDPVLVASAHQNLTRIKKAFIMTCK